MASSSPASGAQPGTMRLEVQPEHADQRIDNYLLRELKGAPRQLVYRLLRTGKVRCNRKRARAGQRLQAGDIISLPALRLGERRPLEFKNPRELPVAYEDGDYLIFDKPAGLAVHGGSGMSYGLIEAARHLRGEQSLELVHRLDKDTSGLLVVAKSRRGLRHAAALLREGKVEKIYRALVWGRWSGEHARINLPLRQTPAQQGGKRSVVADDGARAETSCRCLRQYAAGAELTLKLVTGKTHQARAHLAAVDHPIVGDDRYGDRERNRVLARRGCRGLMLHAARLGLELPGGEKLMLDSQVPERFERGREALRQRSAKDQPAAAKPAKQ